MKDRIRKLVIVALLSFAVASAAFAGIAQTNGRKVYSVDDPIYQALEDLYISRGFGLPSSSAPYTAGEIAMMLERIDVENLRSYEKELYQYIEKRVYDDVRIEPESADGRFGFSLSLDLAAEFYYHTNPEQFSSPDSFGPTTNPWDWNEATPFISLPLETWIGDHIYGFADFTLGLNRTMSSVDYETLEYYSNIPFVPPTGFADLNLNFPYRAFGVLGGEQWSITMGRDRLNWGPGESGSLIVGDQIPFHNNIRLTAYSKPFKYIFSISSFTHPMNYIEKDVQGNEHLSLDFSQNEPLDGLFLFIAHRLEWRIVNKIDMALTETIVYQSETNHLDLLVLSPTAFFHNYYIRANANSILAFDMDYTPFRHLNIYGQVVIDEINIMESEAGDVGNPSAIGFLAGMKTSFPVGKGMMRGYVEGAYTDPYLYIRERGRDSGVQQYGLNYVAAVREFSMNHDLSNYTLMPIGYKYGNDAIVVEAGIGYERYGKWAFDATFTYVADGTFDINSIWSTVATGTEEDPSAPTDSGTGSYLPGDGAELRNAVAHHFNLSVTASFTIVQNLEIHSTVNVFNTMNYRNIEGEKAGDVQLVIGLAYSL